MIARHRTYLMAAMVAAIFLAVGSAAAQQKNTAKTAWGDPDLTGAWSFATLTPLERPSELAGKDTFTNEEAEAFVKQRREEQNADRRDNQGRGGVINGTLETADVARAYNDFWWDRGSTVAEGNRTSLIVDPADGKVPPLTAQARKRAETRREIVARPAEGPEDRPAGERCLHQQRTGPPIQSAGYNNNLSIFQNKDVVAIISEQIHETRFIPLDGRPRPAGIRQWKGISRGRWDGNTLVVETVGYNGKAGFRESGQQLTLVERFSRVDDDTLMYEYTVTDTDTWVRPWTVQMPMSKLKERIYEYACHEGNYGLASALRGARFVEREAASKTSSTSR